MTIPSGISAQAGEIVPGLYLLGHPVVPVFLLTGEKPALIDAGFACFAGAYLEDLGRYLGDRRPEHLFLTHAHYDHCGAAGWLKEAHPNMVVAGSAQARAILQRPNALKLIRRLNQKAAEIYQDMGLPRAGDYEFKPVEVEEVLADGQEISLGGDMSLQVLATPGHTRDCLSYYIPQKKILFVGEAAGTRQRDGYIVSEFLADYQAYEDSLRRLAELEVEVLCQAHHYVHLGPAAGEFLRASLRQARKFKDAVLALLEEHHGDVETVIQKVREFDYDPRQQPKQPLPAYLINLRARVEHLARQLKASPNK